MINEKDWEILSERLKRSKFRSRFHLSEKDKDYVRDKGMDTIERHARDFVSKRLKDETLVNDGKQTPMKGHPVFIAQHATACCCRGCLEKWHAIKRGHVLSDDEMDYIVSVIMFFIKKEMNE